MRIREISDRVIEELRRTLSGVGEPETDRLIEALLSSGRVFVAGAGRSGLMVRAFAMRLMHLGLETHVVGETTTPSLQATDLLLIGSGSGETSGLVAAAGKARSLGTAIGLITVYPESSIGKIADIVIRIPAATPKVETTSSARSIQPMGSLFEQSLLLFLDSVILRLMEKLGQDSEQMFTRHANLE